jgi:hypothetical protein
VKVPARARGRVRRRAASPALAFGVALGLALAVSACATPGALESAARRADRPQPDAGPDVTIGVVQSTVYCDGFMLVAFPIGLRLVAVDLRTLDLYHAGQTVAFDRDLRPVRVVAAAPLGR